MHRSAVVCFPAPPSSREQKILLVGEQNLIHSKHWFSLMCFIFVLLFCLQGYLVFKDFCETQCDEPVPQLAFYEDVSERAFIPYINLFIYLYIFPTQYRKLLGSRGSSRIFS